MVCADARIVLIAAVRASWDMVRIAFTRAKVMQKRIRYTFYFALRFALRYAGRCLCNFILFFAASIRFFCLCSFIFVLNQLKSHYYEKILIIALVAFYAVAVGFFAVYEVRALQSFVGAGGFDGPDTPGFDILMMPCPFCGVPGKLVKTNYDNKPGEYYTCLNCMFLFQVIRD